MNFIYDIILNLDVTNIITSLSIGGVLYVAQPYLTKLYTNTNMIFNLLLDTNQNKIGLSCYKFCQIFYQLFKIKFIQLLNKNVQKINSKDYEISYVINNKLYKIIVTPIRGPSRVLQVTNENNVDITEHVLSYLGPRYDWHKRVFYSDFFNSTKLTFELSDCTTQIIDMPVKPHTG